MAVPHLQLPEALGEIASAPAMLHRVAAAVGTVAMPKLAAADMGPHLVETLQVVEADMVLRVVATHQAAVDMGQDRRTVAHRHKELAAMETLQPAAIGMEGHRRHTELNKISSSLNGTLAEAMARLPTTAHIKTVS